MPRPQPALQGVERRHALILAGIALAFVSIATAVSVTRGPWWDEGMLADPAYHLAAHGYMGSGVMNEYGHPIVRHFPGYNRYTYWTAPLYLVSLAGWFRVFGFSLLAARLLSVLCGLGLIGSCFAIARRLSASAGFGLLAAALVATDYTVLLSSVTVRMDIMAAALGYGAIAVYLRWRERSLTAAAAASSALAAASVFTHPVALLHTGGLLFTAIYFDRRRLRLKHFLVAACPYFALTALWGLYVAEAPGIFWKQITAHAGYRVAGLMSPIHCILWDWRYRYLTFFFPRSGGAERLKVIVLIVYALAFAAALAAPAIRRAAGVVYLVLLTALYYSGLAVLDDAQFPHYMVHTITALALLLALTAGYAWRARLAPRPLIAAALACFMALQLGGHVLKIRADTYATAYEPTLRFLEMHASPETLIDGPAQLLFGLGEGYRLVDDARLGGLSGRRPDIIVLDNLRPGAAAFAGREPDMARWVGDVLDHRFHVAASYGEYRIYLPDKPAQ